MIKFFLLGVIVLAGALLGNAFVGEQQQRLAVLLRLHSGAKALRSALLDQQMDYEQALLYADSSGCSGLFAAYAQQMRRHPQDKSDAWAEAAVQSSGFSLGTAELAALKEWLGRLAAAAVGAQIAQDTAQFLARLQRITAEVRDVQVRRARAIRTLCIMGSLTLVIVLL